MQARWERKRPAQQVAILELVFLVASDRPILFVDVGQPSFTSMILAITPATTMACLTTIAIGSGYGIHVG